MSGGGFERKVDEIIEGDTKSPAQEAASYVKEAWEEEKRSNPDMTAVAASVDKLDNEAAFLVFAHMAEVAELSPEEQQALKTSEGGGNRGLSEKEVEQREAPEGMAMDFMVNSMIAQGATPQGEPTESFGGGGKPPPGDTARGAGWNIWSSDDDYAEGGEGEGDGGEEGGGEGKPDQPEDPSAKASAKAADRAPKNKSEGGRAAKPAKPTGEDK